MCVKQNGKVIFIYLRKSKAEKHVITEDNFNNNYLKRI